MGPRYRKLRSQYIEELRRAKSDVNEWWTRLVADTLAKVGTKVAAAAELKRRWPQGPAAHPRILAIVRKYYLACDRLNKEVRRNQSSKRGEVQPHTPLSQLGSATEEEGDVDLPINPTVFVGESLFTAETDDLARMIGELSYWPIGMDEKGTYV